jgi:hypothetical protein
VSARAGNGRQATTLLKGSIPGIERVAVLWNSDDPTAHFLLEEAKLGAVAGDTASVGILVEQSDKPSFNL